MISRQSILRALDANRNRALEGLRVAEDILRFGFNAAAHVTRLRTLRHGIANAVRALPVSSHTLARARDTRTDVGRRFAGSRTASAEQLLLINLQRAKEALRVLEELSRLIAPTKARRFQRLRFDLYAQERRVLIHVAALRHH